MDSEIKLSPSTLLVEVMESFGESEPRDMLIIFTNEAGDICWKSSTASLMIKLGLIELTKACLIKQL